MIEDHGAAFDAFMEAVRRQDAYEEYLINLRAANALHDYKVATLAPKVAIHTRLWNWIRRNV